MNWVDARKLLGLGGWQLSLAFFVVGCLVTEQPDWDEENVPANVLAQSPATFTRVGAIPDTTCSPSGTTGPMRPMEPGNTSMDNQPWVNFVVQVYDANLEDRLVGRVLINGEHDRDNSKSIIPITGRKDRDPVSFCLTYDQLKQPCNHVEFLVSKRFEESGSLYDTEDPEDFAKVEWWVLGPAEIYPDVSADACEQLLRVP